MGVKFTQFSQLPREVVDFLVSFEARQKVTDLLASYGVAMEDLNPILDLVEAVVFGEVDIRNFPDAFGKATGIPAESVRDASVDFALLRLLPIANAVGVDVESALRSWGADPARIDGVARIRVATTVPKAEPEPEVEEEAVATDGPSFADPIMQHRLELIVGSYRDGVRTKEQAVAVLGRSVKTGGLEMSEGEANDVLEMAGPVEEKGLVDTNLQIGYQSTNQRIATDDETVEVAGAKPDHFSDADAVEVARIAEVKKAAMETPTLITDTKAAADRIVAEAKLAFPSGEVRTRFDHIIDARLRDVRDGFGTREKLEASVESGGVGMSGAPLVAAMELVENMDAMHHLALGAKTDMLKEQIRLDRSDRLDRKEDEKAVEAQVMSQRYAEITGKAPEAHVEPSTAARTSVAIPAAMATEQRAQSIDTSKVKAAIEAAKAAEPVVTPVMSAATISTTMTGRPIVEDIRFERKLAGPVEELRMLTLSDFRRLSSDPKQAILRVRDKVELAAQEGYEHRIAAIRAWRESPLSQLYVAVSREALMAGKSIVDVLAEKRSKGEETLREDELHAIVELNGILRF